MAALAFVNTIWPQYSAHLLQPFISAERTCDDPNTRKLYETLRSVSRRVPVIRIKMYNSSGTAIYSLVLNEIGEDKSANPGFRMALTGKAMSELTHRGSMSVSEGKIENVSVISTYIPVAQTGERAEAVFELYSDVPESLSMIQQTTLRPPSGRTVGHLRSRL